MMKNANTEAAEIVEDLDPLSDRYRVCPNCKKPHMVRNRGKDFCSDRCADQHYNARRRLMKQVEPKNNSAVVVETNGADRAPPVVSSSAAATPPVDTHSTAEPQTERQLSAYEWNIIFLDAQSIHPETGSKFSIDDFMKFGFVFGAFAGRGVLHNIDPKLNCHFVQYGPYRIYRLDFTVILVTKNQTSKN